MTRASKPRERAWASEAQYEAACRKRGVEPERPKLVKRQPVPRVPSRGEEALAIKLGLEVEAGRLPPFEREHRFHPERRWRFDFAFVAQRLAVEVEGGLHSRGRHVRAAGFEADALKYAEASIAGWSVLRVPTSWALDSRALNLVKRWMAERAPDGARR